MCVGSLLRNVELLINGRLNGSKYKLLFFSLLVLAVTSALMITGYYLFMLPNSRMAIVVYPSTPYRLWLMKGFTLPFINLQAWVFISYGISQLLINRRRL